MANKKNHAFILITLYLLVKPFIFPEVPGLLELVLISVWQYTAEKSRVKNGVVFFMLFLFVFKVITLSYVIGESPIKAFSVYSYFILSTLIVKKVIEIRDVDTLSR